jgi:hypothetical protein
MSPGIAAFVIILTAIVCFTFLVANWMKLRSLGRGGGAELGATREVELLSAENIHLKGQVGRLEERLAVLERIATDPSERTAREIEQLRHHS